MSKTKTKRGPGRPPKYKSRTRTTSLVIPVGLLSRLDSKAKKAGQSRSEFVVDLLAQAIGGRRP